MTSPELRTAFKARLACRNERLPGGRHASALEVLQDARRDVSAGRVYASRTNRLDHGDVIRIRTDGKRRTFVVSHGHDSDMGKPWEEHDGHGDIEEAGRENDFGYTAKNPGHRLFSNGERHCTVYAYDVQATTKRAKAEGWGINPEQLAKLERKAGRKATPRMIRAEAVRLDYERCAGWVNDSWHWMGVQLIELPRDEETDPAAVADAWAYDHGRQSRPGTYAAGLWGIESDAEDGGAYLSECARELLSEV